MCFHTDIDSDDSDSETTQNKYLAASLEFHPGHFACDLKWKKDFTVHPRLKYPSSSVGLSRGISQWSILYFKLYMWFCHIDLWNANVSKRFVLFFIVIGMRALRTVMAKLSVINRTNMFVIKESNGAVFYVRWGWVLFCMRSYFRMSFGMISLSYLGLIENCFL